MADTTHPEDLYGSKFYESHREGTARSAHAVVPFLVDTFEPHSVVDIGCGDGEWLAAFHDRGIRDLVGVDGAWSGPHQRALGYEFIEQDLSKPIAIDRTFDLALCLEVAEHLPIEASDQLVGALTCLAPVVVFSAAIPFQGGDGHISERWTSHWAALFESHGFVRAADLRWRFWDDDRIAFWYRQNMLCYVDRRKADILERLKREESSWIGGAKEAMNVVHPDLYLRYCRQYEQKSQRADHLETWLERANGEIAGTKKELSALRSDLHDARRKLEQAREELSEIKSSRSWRLIQRLMPVVHTARRVKSFFGISGRTD